MSSPNRVALNRRASAMVAPAAIAGEKPLMMAFEWNNGMDRYSTSSEVSPNDGARFSPDIVTVKLPTCTAFGSPDVPEVKMSMNGSMASTGGGSWGADDDATSAAHSSESVSITLTSPRSRPSSSGLSSQSVRMTWHSDLRMSRASPSPRRVALRPTVTYPPSAPAANA